MRYNKNTLKGSTKNKKEKERVIIRKYYITRTATYTRLCALIVYTDETTVQEVELLVPGNWETPKPREMRKLEKMFPDFRVVRIKERTLEKTQRAMTEQDWLKYSTKIDN